MNLPPHVQQAIEEELLHTSTKELKKAREELTSRYLAADKQVCITLPLHRKAYLVSRLPATFAVLLDVLGRIPFPIETFVDLGAGPATGLLAALESFPHLKSATLYERDAPFIEIGKRLCPHPATWIQADLTRLKSLPPADLTLFSYSLGELPPEERVRLLSLCPGGTLAIVEPGTQEGFHRLRTLREFLLKQGWNPVAPCPHASACPHSWCHFSVRVARSSLHRLLKDGALGYEDEKFSYFIASKVVAPLPQARVLSDPKLLPHGAELTLCTPRGIEKRLFPKKAKKIKWGAELEIESFSQPEREERVIENDSPSP